MIVDAWVPTRPGFPAGWSDIEPPEEQGGGAGEGLGAEGWGRRGANSGRARSNQEGPDQKLHHGRVQVP
jgi:hypothetical protein